MGITAFCNIAVILAMLCYNRVLQMNIDAHHLSGQHTKDCDKREKC